MTNRDYLLYEVDSVGNLKELLQNASAKYGSHTAFTFKQSHETTHVTYEQFKADVEALGTALFDMGIRDAKVALIGENSYEWILSYFTTVNGGNVIVPLDKELPLQDLTNLLINCQASVLIFSDDYRDIADGLLNEQLNIKHKINIKYELKALIKKGKELVTSDMSYVEYKIDRDKLATIIYTSGTTGSPKGVMLSHKNIARDVVISCQNIYFFGVSLLVLPLHHSFAFTGGVLIMMHWGCNIVINRSLKELSDDLVTHKPNNILFVPLYIETLYKKIWDSAKKSGKYNLLKTLINISNVLLRLGIDFRAKLFKQVLATFGGELDVLVTGGAPIDSSYIKGFREFGVKVLNGYGISECSPVVSVNRNNYYRDGSVGLVLPSLEVNILEPDDTGCGEICVKGDIVMLGYYKNEQATKEAFDDGWFKTGDVGFLDQDGFLYISGRKKNLIILSNGKNVYPEELEFALLNHITYIKEALVYAEDSTIVAEIFMDTENKSGCVTCLNNDIVELNRTLPLYKNIGKTIIRNTEFSKTTTKKIKR